MGDVGKGKEEPVENGVKCHLVLVFRGGSTTRGKEGEKELSASENEHTLEKGVGRGGHQSDVIR